MVTSDFTSELEIRPFRACAMHPAIVIGTVRSLCTCLCSRYHVPQNAFLVVYTNCKLFVCLLFLSYHFYGDKKMFISIGIYRFSDLCSFRSLCLYSMLLDTRSWRRRTFLSWLSSICATYADNRFLV